MGINLRLIPLLLMLMLVILVQGCERRKEVISFKAGAPAPDFVLNDLNGNPVRLSDFKGKIVLLEFWTTWCPPCKLATSELNEIYTKYAGSNLAILSVSLDENIEAVKYYVAENEILFPVLFDDKNANQSFGVYTIPTALVLDEEGVVIEHHLGYSPGIFEELLEDVKDRL